MADYDYLSVSNGSGDAALMHITDDRLTGSATIEVDNVTNVPTKFLATAGTALPSGFIDPTTKIEFKGHLSGGDLIIDSYEPGSTDAGNTSGQIVVIKPNTGWGRRVATFIQNATNFGTPESVTFAGLVATAISAASAVLTGNLTVGGNTALTGNITIAGTSKITPASVTTADGSNNITPTSQEFEVTALAAAATIVVPSYTAANMQAGILKIKDNGTAFGLTWASGWLGVGVTLPTTTTAGKWMYINYKYSLADTKYHVLGIARQA